MESRRKRRRSQLYKWGLYVLLLLACTVLQTIPGFLQFGQAKPVFLLPLALAVAVCEDEFSGAPVRRRLRPDVGLYRRPHRRPAGPGPDGAELWPFGWPASCT